jgi:tRNA threonylcarbamoyladenosine biosynthesis protein TsaB
VKQPLTLAIETSNPSAGGGGVALVAGEGGGALGVLDVLGVLGVESVSREPQQDDLMAAIARLCARCQKSPRDLTRVAVSIGPGGYTAVRVAVTVAKMICEATGAACVGVPTPLVVARRVDFPGPFAVALASKGETALVTRFENGAPGPGALIDASGLTSLHIKLLIADAFLPPTMRARAAELGIPVQPPVFDPVACAQASEAIPPTDPAALLPLYPREPEAVTKWRALKGL